MGLDPAGPEKGIDPVDLEMVKNPDDPIVPALIAPLVPMMASDRLDQTGQETERVPVVRTATDRVVRAKVKSLIAPIVPASGLIDRIAPAKEIGRIVLTKASARIGPRNQIVRASARIMLTGPGITARIMATTSSIDVPNG
jgi:hypothetical protein